MYRLFSESTARACGDGRSRVAEPRPQLLLKFRRSDWVAIAVCLTRFQDRASFEKKFRKFNTQFLNGSLKLHLVQNE